MNSMERRIHAVAEMSRGKSEGEIQRASDYLHGVADKALSDRIETFGALRRAVEVARREDEAHERYEAKYGASFTSEHKRAAYAIRQAIRAALNTSQNSTENSTVLA